MCVAQRGLAFATADAARRSACRIPRRTVASRRSVTMRVLLRALPLMNPHRLLLVGGGHSHVEVLRRQASAARRDTAVTLVSPSPLTPYSGMLPGLVAGMYDVAATHIALPPLAAAAGAGFVEDRVVHLDLAAKVARLAAGGSVPFDTVSLDVGSKPTATIAGARKHAVGVKPVDRFLDALTGTIEAAREGRIATIVVVGGGAGGIEILLAMQARLAAEPGVRTPRFALVTDVGHLLPRHAPAARRLVRRTLDERGIAIHFDAAAAGVERDAVLTRDGRRIAADRVFLATPAAATPWLAASGLACDAAGFVDVDAHLRSTSHPYVFAAGDCASQRGAAYPKSGLYAVRQGPVLADNLRRHVRGEPLRDFRPQRTALALLATGDRRAIMSWGAFAAEGAWVWRWKDAIDRRFMARYRFPASTRDSDTPAPSD
jgi:selenide,water dikinase